MEPIADPLAAFELPNQIHPENLVGVPGVSAIAAKNVKNEQESKPAPQADAKTTVAERAAALARKKEDEVDKCAPIPSCLNFFPAGEG